MSKNIIVTTDEWNALARENINLKQENEKLKELLYKLYHETDMTRETPQILLDMVERVWEDFKN